MSTLQIGLALAGGAVLAAVVAHGAWNARKNQPRQADPALAPTPDFEQARIDPIVADFLQSPGAEVSDFALPAAAKNLALDALIDVIVPLSFDAAISGDAALQALPATRRVGSKLFAVEAWDEASQQWLAPAPGQRYQKLQAGVQLANRVGPLNSIEYSEFVVTTQAYADALGGTPEFPEMPDQVARARELDTFASAHDAQLGITLRARSAAWSPGYVQQHAARLGFVAGALPGRMVLPASMAGLSPILGLAFDPAAALADDPAQSALRELTLSLDVPQVPRSEQPYVRMREAAKQLAQTMDSLITDDNGQVLSDDAMDLIGADLEALYDTLDERELSAGSVLARRLFS